MRSRRCRPAVSAVSKDGGNTRSHCRWPLMIYCSTVRRQSSCGGRARQALDVPAQLTQSFQVQADDAEAGLLASRRHASPNTMRKEVGRIHARDNLPWLSDSAAMLCAHAEHSYRCGSIQRRLAQSHSSYASTMPKIAQDDSGLESVVSAPGRLPLTWGDNAPNRTDMVTARAHHLRAQHDNHRRTPKAYPARPCR